MDASAIFLQRYPQSVYAAAAHRFRGKILRERARPFYPVASLEDAIKEFKQALLAPLAEVTQYVCTLSNLKDCYLDLGDPATASLYGDAHELFWKRWRENDLRAVTIGVNDFLGYLNQLTLDKNTPLPPLFSQSTDFLLSCAPAVYSQ